MFLVAPFWMHKEAEKQNAHIYLIDEPCANLSPHQRIVAARVIKRFIQDSNKTAFVVERDFAMVDHLADKVILFEGTPSVNCVAHAPQPWNLFLAGGGQMLWDGARNQTSGKRNVLIQSSTPGFRKRIDDKHSKRKRTQDETTLVTIRERESNDQICVNVEKVAVFQVHDLEYDPQKRWISPAVVRGKCARNDLVREAKFYSTTTVTVGVSKIKDFSTKERHVSLALGVIPGPSSGIKAAGLRRDMVSRIPARCHTKGVRYCPSARREDQTVDVTALPKFDMPSYELKMTAKEVKSLALRHGIPLDLHPVALTEGWTMDKLPDDMIACAVRIEPIDYVRAILSEPKYRSFCKFIPHFYKVSKQGHWFSFEKRVGKGAGDRRAITDGMAWRRHDSDINDPVPEDGCSMQDVEALTERVIDLRPVPSGLLFQGGASISKGPVLSSQDCIPQHTTCPLPEGQNIPEKTDHQRRVEVEDPKIVANRERKARAAAKKRERKKQGGDGGEGSRPKTKRGKPQVVGMDLLPLRPLPVRSPSGHSTLINLLETDDLNLGSSGEQSERALTLVNTEVIQPSLACQRTNRGPTADRVVTPLRTTTQGANAVEGESSREGALYVPGAQEKSNALNNATALERAWFSLARGSIAQTDILERFENLQTEFDRLFESHVECGDLSGKFVQARLDLTHSSHLYTSISDSHKALNNEPEGCARKLEGLENRNRGLSQANRDRVLQIKELEDALSPKDSALVYAKRINAEQAQEKERLVSQVGRAEMEKFNCIRKLLPTVERSEEDLLELMGRMEGFDIHADTKMRVEYDKLFERRHPYVEKISRGFRHYVSDLLKVYPDSPPREQVPLHKPSFEKAPSTSAPPGS
nr:transposase (putative), gypsy type [Tanacetum cinerariifolium]